MLDEFITCPRCARDSYHPEDIRNRYCGACAMFHAEPLVPANATALSVRTALSKATREHGAPLDPKVRAQIRRDAGDQEQIAWDTSLNPAAMLKALMQERGADPAVLLPPARFIEFATKRFEENGKIVAPTIWNQTMRTSAKMILQGRFGSAVTWLRHAYTGAGLALSPASAYVEMAEMVRHFFPVAPAGWEHQPLSEREALKGDEYGPGVLQRALPAWRRLNPPREQ